MKKSSSFLNFVAIMSLFSLFLISLCEAKAKIQGGADDEEEVRSTIASDPYAGGGSKKRNSPAHASIPKKTSSSVSGVLIDEKNNKLTLSTPIRFDENNALAIPSQGIVLKVVDLLKNNPQMRIRIIVHTDSLGTDQKNLENTQKRAQSLGVYLMQNGIDMSRFELVGMGDRETIASDETKEGREKNRRVEFLLLTPIQVPAAPNTLPPPPFSPPPAQNPIPTAPSSETPPSVVAPSPSAPPPPAEASPSSLPQVAPPAPITPAPLPSNPLPVAPPPPPPPAQNLPLNTAPAPSPIPNPVPDLPPSTTPPPTAVPVAPPPAVQ